MEGLTTWRPPLGIPKPVVGGAPSTWALAGLECWVVKAQFSGILFCRLSVFCSIGSEGLLGVDQPVLRVMRLFERIAGASMACRKNSVPRACPTRRIELDVHELVHVLQN